MRGSAILLVAATACVAGVLSMPTTPQTTRQALFFAEQRAGRVGYVGWPPLNCKTDSDCQKIGLNGTYCVNDPTKTAPFFCHEPEVILQSGLARPTGLTVDVKSQQVFFAEDDQTQGDTYWPLRAINVDGTGKRVLIEKLLDPQGMDAQDGKVYYTEHHGQRVGVVDFDGKNQKVLHTFSDEDYPGDVKVDVAAGKVFVVVEGKLTTGQKLAVMDLDGGNFQFLLTDLIQAYGLTLLKDTKEIYYVQGGHGGFVAKMGYDGKSQTKVLDILEYPYMLAYNPDSKKLCFSEAGVGDGSLKVMNLDGSDVEKSLTLGFAPMGVNFGEVPVTNVLQSACDAQCKQTCCRNGGGAACISACGCSGSCPSDAHIEDAWFA